MELQSGSTKMELQSSLLSQMQVKREWLRVDFEPLTLPCNVAISVDSEPETEVSQVTEEPVLVTASAKIRCPSKKWNEHKTFILRDVDVSKMKLVSSLKQEILSQFGGEVISKGLKFDIGYYHGTKRIWIRNETDLNDLIEIMQSRVATLWCNGLCPVKNCRKMSAFTFPSTI